MHDCTVAEDIHHPQYVADLFDRCAANYRITSAIASFGFVLRWRHQCIGQLRTVQPKETPVVYDLMAGTGEIWPYVIRQIATDARIVAVDISRVMHEHAVQKLHASRSEQIEHVQADVLEAEFPNSVADYVVSTFGLKTMNPAQLKRIAQVTAAMLKPGAQFTFIEASDPKGWMLRPFYRLYMDSVLPLVEKTVLKGAKDFSMIGDYTRSFGNCERFAGFLESEGLVVKRHKYMFGCATGVSGFRE